MRSALCQIGSRTLCSDRRTAAYGAVGSIATTQSGKPGSRLPKPASRLRSISSTSEAGCALHVQLHLTPFASYSCRLLQLVAEHSQLRNSLWVLQSASHCRAGRLFMARLHRYVLSAIETGAGTRREGRVAMKNTAPAECVLALINGKLTAEDREIVHRSGIIHFCAHLLCTTNDELFLQRRSVTRKRNPDSWTSTVSGHISADDAWHTSNSIQRTTLEEAGRNAIRHEFTEELGIPAPVDFEPEFLGRVRADSRSPTELCNCEALVYATEITAIPNAHTEEVEEVAGFQLAEVAAKLAAGQGLRGGDGKLHPFADNFPSVFRCFLASRSITGRLTTLTS